VDTIELGRAFAREEKWWTDWVLPDGTPCLMPVWAKPLRENGSWVLRSRATGRIISRMLPEVIYFEQMYWPFAEEDRLDQLQAALTESMWTAMASPPGPIAAGVDGDKLLAQGAQQLRRESERAMIGLFGGNLLEMGQFLYRNDNFFLLLAGDPNRCHDVLDRRVEMDLANLIAVLGQ